MTPATPESAGGGRSRGDGAWPRAGAWALFLLLAVVPVGGPLAELALRLLSGGALPHLGSWTLTWHSITLAATAALLALTQGLGLALWFAGGFGLWRRILRKVYLLPLLLPPYFYALGWMALFARGGWASSLFTHLAGTSPTPYGFWGSALVLGQAFAPLVAWMTLGALQGLEAGPVEAACVLRGPNEAWFRAVLPAVAPSALAGASLAFAFGLVEYGVPSLLQFNVYSMEIYADFSQSGDAASAAGLALPVLLPAIALAAAVGAFGRLLPSRSVAEGARARLEAVSLPRPLGVLAWGSAISSSLGLLLPFGLLAANLFKDPPPSMAQGWGPLAFSLALAAAAGLSAALLALPLAWTAEGRTGHILEVACLAALAVPAPLFGIGAALLANRSGLASGAPALAFPWLAHVGRFLPLSVLVVASHLRFMDPLLRDGVRLATAPPATKAFRLVLPLALPGLMVAAGFTAALSLGEIGATLLVCPPGYQTVALRLYNLLHYGADASAAALALATAAAAGVLAAGIWTMVRWRWA